jgi:hypothetical protein
MKSKWYVYSFIGAILFMFIYFNYIHKSNEDIIKEKCNECEKFEEIKKTNWILVSKGDGLSNIWDITSKTFLLNNWCKAVYDDGVFFDDITFTFNGESFIVADTDYNEFAKLKDEYFTKDESDLQDDVINNHCSMCDRDFKGNGYGQNDYGKVVPFKDPQIGDKCSFSCANKAKEQSNEEFDEISRKYGIDVNSGNNSNSEDPNGYHMENDGRVYENDKCELCRGTGIEKGQNIISGKVEGRICPMCEGKGVRSY